MENTIGLFGLGDLGRRLAVQLVHAGFTVLAHDPQYDKISEIQFEKGVDPDIPHNPTSDIIELVDHPSRIIDSCTIIHWAIPSQFLNQLPPLTGDTTVILHDSVMNNSSNAIVNRSDNSSFVAVHCLMNASRRVFIDSSAAHRQLVLDHFLQLQLAPKWTTVLEHDRHMARSQGIFALLIALGMREELEAAHLAGDLTPSADELRLAVANREANWKPQTLVSILSNPELLPFVEEIAQSLRIKK